MGGTHEREGSEYPCARARVTFGKHQEPPRPVPRSFHLLRCHSLPPEEDPHDACPRAGPPGTREYSPNRSEPDRSSGQPKGPFFRFERNAVSDRKGRGSGSVSVSKGVPKRRISGMATGMPARADQEWRLLCAFRQRAPVKEARERSRQARDRSGTGSDRWNDAATPGGPGGSKPRRRKVGYTSARVRAQGLRG